MLRRLGHLLAPVVLLVCALVAFAAPIPAQAAYTGTVTADLPAASGTLAPVTDLQVTVTCGVSGNIQVNWTPSATAAYVGPSRTANGGYTVVYTLTLNLLGVIQVQSPSTVNVADLASTGVTILDGSPLLGISVSVTSKYYNWTSTTVSKTPC